jgi:hypothetical protein
MAESLAKKTTPIKKVRFNEKVQVFIIQAEDRKSTTLRSLPNESWIPFAGTKPLSEKLKESPRQYRTSEDLINSYLHRKAKQPFTYWDVIKTNPSLAFTPTIPIGREELTTPAKRGPFPSTSFPHLRGFSYFNQRITTPSCPRRTMDRKNGQFSEILAIYGNNPSLRSDKKPRPDFLTSSIKGAQVNVQGAFRDELKRTHQEKGATGSTIFPHFKSASGVTQRPLKSTSYFFY